jgi:putative toxin-antitoxin system antitoxin component (TIGR02293 family)
MSYTVLKNGLRTNKEKAVLALANVVRQKAPATEIAWLILGGKGFMTKEPVSGLDFLTASVKGIPKLSVENIARIMNIPMKDMAALLNLSYKTLARKRKTDVLNNVVSSLSIEIANTLAKGLSVFEDADTLNRWLHKENKALNGQKPFDLLNTPTGINLVNQILGRIEDGVYS